jgi:PilZ domain-containing protein
MFAARPITTGRRRFVRVPLGRLLEFWTDSDDYLLGAEAIGKDVSLGGMFVETDIPCRCGERVRTQLTFPGSRRELVLWGIVRWTCREGIGMQFGRLGARETHEIIAFTMR